MSACRLLHGMEILREQADVGGFFERLAKAGRRALLLDYDGTLAPFRLEPSEGVPYPGVKEILDAIIQRGCTRVVLVSGRAVNDLVPLLGLKQLPEVWGSHGLERMMPDRTYQSAEVSEAAAAALAQARAWAAREGLADRCEVKPGCLALHLRGAEPSLAEAIRRRARAEWLPLSQRGGLALCLFDGGLEMRLPARNKGDAVDTVLSEMGPESTAAYLGDDVTDEDAFAAIRGRGLAVLVRQEIRPTMADVWIRPGEELLDFLNRWTLEDKEDK